MTIALQLYTVRDALAADYSGTIAKVASFGYTAVETAGVYLNNSPSDSKRLFDAHGLRVISAHGVLVDGTVPAQALDAIGALGTNIWVCAWESPERFASLETIRAFADQLNTFAAALADGGGRLAYHNHDFELHPLPDGSLPLLRLAEMTDQAVLFEVDTYWVQTGGANVVEVLGALGNRAALLHIKDGPAVPGVVKTAVGQGVMDFPAILAAAPSDAPRIVELDDCDSDMLTAVAQSYDYLNALVTTTL